MRDVVFATAMGLAVATIAVASAQFTRPLEACPSEDVVKTAIRNRALDFNAGAIGVKSIGEFQFSQVAFGEIARDVVVDLGAPVDVCPLVVNYQYVITANNGERRLRTFHENTIHYFFIDPTRNWNYRTGGSAR